MHISDFLETMALGVIITPPTAFSSAEQTSKNFNLKFLLAGELPHEKRGVCGAGSPAQAAEPSRVRDFAVAASCEGRSWA